MTGSTVKPRIGSVCSGYGGLEMGVQSVVGGEVAWHAQFDPDDKRPLHEQPASRILAHHWPDVPNHGDVTAIDWTAVEPVEVLCAGFPCQDLSLAGKGAGMRRGNRSGLWFHIVDAIDTLRPGLVVLENVRGLLSSGADSDVEPCPWCLGDAGSQHALRALGAVLGDLADIGFDAEWCGLRAADVGAPHGRFRVFITAWPSVRDSHGGDPHGRAAAGLEGEARPSAGPAADADDLGHERLREARGRRPGPAHGGDGTLADTDGAGPQGRGLGRPAGQAVVGDGAGAARPGLAAGDAARVRRGHAGPPSQRGLQSTPVADDLRTDWGPYSAAIHRWEGVLGRRAPAPTITGRLGNPKLSPYFVEWLMGLPAGHVTAVPGLTVNQQLKALGNGVVPAQAAAALAWMLAREASVAA